jgi:outer membrane lipoprotein-sorting protein
MHKASKPVFLALFVLSAMILLSARPAMAAPAAPDEKEKEKVLRRLDVAAANFRSTSADFQFDSVETDPISEDDVQKGTVFYERAGSAFQMAAHIREFNGKPVPKVYVYSGGAVKLYEPLINQVTTITKASQYESWFMLGFGASGKDLEQKWEIKYLGSEMLLDDKTSVKTEKLEMVPRDPAIRKNLSKVTMWVDPERGVSLKQVLNFGPTEYKVCVYFNIKVNQPLPKDAFTFKTGSKPVFVNR